MDQTDTPPHRPGSPIDLERLTAGLWRTRWLFAAVLFVGCVLGYVVVEFVMGPEYQAEAAIVWEPSETREAAAQHRKLRTLAASIELPRTLVEVKRRSGTAKSLEQLADAMIVNVQANSNILLLYIRSPEPTEAVDLANRVVEVFIEQQREALREHVAEIVGSAKLVRDATLQEMQDARRAYDQFREQEGILDLRVERSAVINKAALLETTADQARAELAAQSERLRILTRAKGKFAEKVVMSETESAPAVLALAKARAELEQLRGVLTEDHPRVQALESQVQTLEKNLDNSLAPVVGQRVIGRHPQRDALEKGLVDAEADQQAALERERTYQTMMKATKHELADLIRLEGKASELITVLELAEKRYADAEAAVGRAEDVARTMTTGLRLASPATLPLEPLSARRRLVIAGAIPFGLLLLAIALVIIFHLRGLRASSSKEIAFWGGGPVVAVAPWPGRDTLIDELCSDLAEPLDGQPDAILIVPFSPLEASHAKTLFESLQSQTNRRSDKRDKPSQTESKSSLSLCLDSDESSIRRACRTASRILVVVQARTHSHFRVYQTKTRLGRAHGFGFVVIQVDRDLANMPDRVGDIDEFWAVPASSLSYS